ncbi:7-deoxyloganetic acid glucosyltransferase-like [Sesamum indicum]|uniref:Glycosyltransferase n=1 Tax=Sesamum indicum TaxID=4182 RepID=A0A6I9UNS8_SESIN|nr:7-deoxyloganetic acid glucosyltransferase-like [Sesamum indicum]
MGTNTELPPHVLIFPLPMQGHINSMLKLAELFCLSNLHVTMLLSEYTHGRLRRHANIESRFSRYPGFRVATIPDGLPEDHPRVGERTMEIVMSLLKVGGAEFRKLMETTDALSDGGARRRVTCLIMDGVLSFAVPVAEEMGIPFIYFRTVGACSFWANFCFKDVIEAGEAPLKGKDEGKHEYWKKEELDLMVTSVPGMEGYLRRRDLPAFCRVNDVNDPGFQTIIRETRRTALSRGLILNSFEDLEGPILDQIRKPIPNLYSIGPLHTHLKARLESQKSEESSLPSSSFYEEDRSSMSWLDSQPPKSVLYVSFGSVTLLTRDELLEFWYGLVNSGHKFLWVMRPDSIVGDNKDNPIPAELEEATKERGYLVGWVPQNEVLAHPSVGAFFTHSGWNSTLEGIAAVMPMICWPYFADQTINSRFVSEVWKVGLDMKDSCDRVIVEKTVRDIMEVRRDEFLERALHMAELAKKSISEGGTSYTNLNRLIEFIRSSV